jgi:bifunctional non-homologous end joining protein LigD
MTDRAQGVVAKQLASVYRPGIRTRSWLKVPRFETVDVAIGGWTPGAGRRQGRIGALLLGVRRDDRLVLAGAVGTVMSTVWVSLAGPCRSHR